MPTIKVMTPKFRVSYPHVFKPQLNKLNNKEEYSVQALFKKGEDLSPLIKAVKECAAAKWGSWDKIPKNFRSPFRKQEERGKEEDGKLVLPAGHEVGAIFITLKSKERPGVVNQKVEDIIDETEFYAGCYARAKVTVYAYSQAGNNGVSFGLQNIQKMSDGDPLGSRLRAQDDFEPIAGAEESLESADDMFATA